MKKILVVGFMPYKYMENLVNAFPNVIWFSERDIGMSESAVAIIDLVEMMDGVMFMDKDGRERMTYEVACCRTLKAIHEKEDYPIEEKEEVKHESV